MDAESYTIFPELALIVHGERLARFVIDKIHHGSDGLIGCDRLAHDLAALRQVFVRDRLRGGQVRALRRDSILIRGKLGISHRTVSLERNSNFCRNYQF